MGLKLTQDVSGWFLQEAPRYRLDPTLPSKYEPYLLTQSPLLIPLEEHWAGELALQMAHQEIAKLRQHPNHSSESLLNILRKYLALLRLHSRKEDECLFILSDQILMGNI